MSHPALRSNAPGRLTTRTMPTSAPTRRKKAFCTTPAPTTPSTVEPRISARRRPSIATVPACAGKIAFSAMPPPYAPRIGLNPAPPRGYAATRMFRQANAFRSVSQVWSASARSRSGSEIDLI